VKISITKGDVADSIEALRADGSAVRTTFPHKGPIPHDAVHFFVESGLGIGDAFWGLVESGRHPEEVQDLAKAAGHASASRTSKPASYFVPVIQAERIVECLEADLWGGGGDPDMLRAMVRSGCEQSLVPVFPLTDAAIQSVRQNITEFREQWEALPAGATYVLNWGARQDHA
jgi:hypothetical protein